MKRAGGAGGAAGESEWLAMLDAMLDLPLIPGSEAPEHADSARRVDEVLGFKINK